MLEELVKKNRILLNRLIKMTDEPEVTEEVTQPTEETSEPTPEAPAL